MTGKRLEARSLQFTQARLQPRGAEPPRRIGRGDIGLTGGGILKANVQKLLKTGAYFLNPERFADELVKADSETTRAWNSLAMPTN